VFTFVECVFELLTILFCLNEKPYNYLFIEYILNDVINVCFFTNPGLEIGKKIGLPLCLVFDRWSKFSPAIWFFGGFHYHFGLPNTHCGLSFGRWQAAISSPETWVFVWFFPRMYHQVLFFVLVIVYVMLWAHLMHRYNSHKAFLNTGMYSCMLLVWCSKNVNNEHVVTKASPSMDNIFTIQVLD